MAGKDFTGKLSEVSLPYYEILLTSFLSSGRDHIEYRSYELSQLNMIFFFLFSFAKVELKLILFDSFLLIALTAEMI